MSDTNLAEFTAWVTLEIDTKSTIKSFNYNFYYTNFVYIIMAAIMAFAGAIMIAWWYDEIIIATDPEKENQLYNIS